MDLGSCKEKAVVIIDDDDLAPPSKQGRRPLRRSAQLSFSCLAKSKASSIQATHRQPSRSSIVQAVPRASISTLSLNQPGSLAGSHLQYTAEPPSRSKKNTYSKRHKSRHLDSSTNAKKGQNGLNSSSTISAHPPQSSSSNSSAHEVTAPPNLSRFNPKKQCIPICLSEDDVDKSFYCQNYTSDQDFQHQPMLEPHDESSKSAVRAYPLGRKSNRLEPMRNLNISSPLVGLDHFTVKGIRINRQTNLELLNGNFIRVINIIQDSATSEVKLQGWVFHRTDVMDHMFELQRNEICWILHIDENDILIPKVQGMELVAVSEVLRRRHIRMTNRPFPELSCLQDPLQKPQTMIDQGVLICRYKYVCSYQDAKAFKRNAWCERSLQRLQAEECDLLFSSPDDQLRQIWRGDTVKGGACRNSQAGEKKYLQQGTVGSSTIQSPQHEKKPSENFQLSHAHKHQQSSKRHGSAPFVIFESGAGSNNDVQEVDVQSFLGRPLGTSQTQASAQNLGYIPAPGANRQLSNYSNMLAFQPKKRKSGFEPNTGILVTKDSPGAKRQKHCSGSSNMMKTAPVDLTDEELNLRSQLSSMLKESRLAHSQKFGPFHQRSARHISPEVVKVRAQIDSFSSLGIIRREYEGLITSTYLATPNSEAQRDSPFIVLPQQDSLRQGSVIELSPDYPTTKGRCQQSPEHEITSMCSQSVIVIGEPARVSKVDRAAIRRRLDTSYSEDIRRGAQCLPFKYVEPRSNVRRLISDAHTRECAEVLSSDMSMRPYDISSVPNRKLSAKPVASAAKYHLLSRPTCQNQRSLPVPASNQQQYTFGDCFCGAGGTSRGAVAAGLRVDWGFDYNVAACESYALNFTQANTYNISADRFSSLVNEDHKVDICHLSPPCQFFSPAHTVEGKDDDKNTASLFAISPLLEKSKPRVATLEQTAGLMQRHHMYFSAAIRMFTSLGFSIRWRVVKCPDYGVPQSRNRLVLIASCPGEALPAFPKPTHAKDPSSHHDFKSWVTINQAIANIPSGWPGHDVDSARRIDGPPGHGDRLSRCITTSGGGNIHPSGKRAYTLRELACLQSFPLEHEFGLKGVKSQIGNAVPPVLARLILDEVRKSLIKADGL